MSGPALSRAAEPDSEPAVGACRLCGTALRRSFVDLGTSPPANAYLRESDLSRPETFYPLHAFVCESCLLVQIEAQTSPEALFGDYAYFSSYSDSWLRHAESFAGAAISRFGLGPDHRVVEVASNDGYLLQYFARAGIRVLGVEPAANVARVAEEKGISTLVRFFGRATARQLVGEGWAADLLVANNVLAHVPDLNDFVAGLAIALKPQGILTLEFPHLLALIRETQFDTIYHEHFSYFSLLTVERVLRAHGLAVVDVDLLPTHGGSLRLYASHAAGGYAVTPAVAALRGEERRARLDRIETYGGFDAKVAAVKRSLLRFLIEAKERGETVVAYGAAAKGNTLLNACGIGTDMIDYVVDRSPHKQGLYLPGSRIPVCPPVAIDHSRPDYVLILPWNLTAEIMASVPQLRGWGGRFVVPIPETRICE